MQLPDENRILIIEQLERLNETYRNGIYPEYRYSAGQAINEINELLTKLLGSYTSWELMVAAGVVNV